MSTSTPILFPTSYLESRAYFHHHLERIQGKWPAAALDRQSISEEDDHSIDWILAEPAGRKQRMILITSGLHGVEGFVGAAMLDLFIKEFLPQIDPEGTGVCLVHALNPWGMAHLKRFNQNNVDLNRNFMVDPGEFDLVFNQNYLKLDRILNPRRPLRPFWQEDPAFIFNVIASIARYGIQSLREAVLLGQQSNPAGLYYTGREYQPETLWVRDLVKAALSSYQQILHLDLHTGYGPSDQMSIVISPSEPRSSAEVGEDYHYPLVYKADPEQFYSMKGDMVDWIYQFQESLYPEVRLFSAAFEFGTYGSGILKETLSLRTMIFINQAVQQGTISPKVASRIEEEFVEMFFPLSSAWREKALADCRQAFTGILDKEGFL